MSKCHSELTPREQGLLKIRRDSDTKAAELVKMEKMLQQTKNMLDKKTEPGSESMGYQENMVEDLEEKVRSSRRYRRNSLHHTQMLESQMKTVKGELAGTLDHLQELRNVLRRSQQKAEERKAAMEKLAAGLRWTIYSAAAFDLQQSFDPFKLQNIPTECLTWRPASSQTKLCRVYM